LFSDILRIWKWLNPFFYLKVPIFKTTVTCNHSLYKVCGIFSSFPHFLYSLDSKNSNQEDKNTV